MIINISDSLFDNKDIKLYTFEANQRLFPNAFSSYKIKIEKTNTLFFVSETISHRYLMTIMKSLDGIIGYKHVDNKLYFLIFKDSNCADIALSFIQEQDLIKNITFSKNYTKSLHNVCRV